MSASGPLTGCLINFIEGKVSPLGFQNQNSETGQFNNEEDGACLFGPERIPCPTGSPVGPIRVAPVLENETSGMPLQCKRMFYNAEWTSEPFFTSGKPPQQDWNAGNDFLNMRPGLAGPYPRPNEYRFCHACLGFWFIEGCGYSIEKDFAETFVECPGLACPIGFEMVCSHCQGHWNTHRNLKGCITGRSYTGEGVRGNVVWRFYGARIVRLFENTFLSHPWPIWQDGADLGLERIVQNQKHWLGCEEICDPGFPLSAKM